MPRTKAGLSTEFEPFLDRVASGAFPRAQRDSTALADYVALALTGGFPQTALGTSPRARQLWLHSYVDQLVTRDAAQIHGGRDPERLRRYFEGYAINSAGVVSEKTLLETAIR